VVLQLWLVRPYFSQWGQTRIALQRAEATLKTYRAEFARTNEYVLKLKELEGQGTGVLAADQAQATTLISQIQKQAELSKLIYAKISVPPKSSATRSTNQFFEEQEISVGVNPTSDDELIDFLIAMGSSDLKVRVKTLTLDPDNTGTKLKGSMVLVASFQKPTPSKPGAAAPAASPVKKP